jgi:hypothetical protein
MRCTFLNFHSPFTFTYSSSYRAAIHFALVCLRNVKRPKQYQIPFARFPLDLDDRIHHHVLREADELLKVWNSVRMAPSPCALPQSPPSQIPSLTNSVVMRFGLWSLSQVSQEGAL